MESIAVAGKRRGTGASWTESMVVARGMKGGFAIVEGLGYRLYPTSKSVIAPLPAFMMAMLLWSLSRVTAFRELLATGVHECRALADVLIGAAGDQLMGPAAAVRAMKPTE